MYGDVNIPNAVLLEIEELGSLDDSRKMARVLTSVVKAWRPAWAGVLSCESFRGTGGISNPLVDWMVFVPSVIDESKVQEPSRIETIAGFGSIVVVRDTPPSRKVPSDVSLIRKVENLVQGLVKWE